LSGYIELKIKNLELRIENYELGVSNRGAENLGVVSDNRQCVIRNE